MIDDGFLNRLEDTPMTNSLSRERIENILSALYKGLHLMAEGLLHEGLEIEQRAQAIDEILRKR